VELKFYKKHEKSCTINGAAFLLRLNMPIPHESNGKFKSTPTTKSVQGFNLKELPDKPSSVFR
jgi:hypothetical protein